ncbi:MAG: hypothetical protein JWM37_546 [Candidatus Saccharibacteria bacterium]|nr:hypothetical protein [Candidatus Saccharibacteria bacterium]
MGNVLPFPQNHESNRQADPEVAELLTIRDHVMTQSLAQATEVARRVLPELQPQPVEQEPASLYHFPILMEDDPYASAA